MNGQSAELPHDIRGLVPNTPPWWSFVILALLVIAAVVLAIWLYRKWKGRKPTPAQSTQIDPWASLHGRVGGMVVPTNFEPGRPQEDYFYGLSLLLREGVELRTRVPATDLTLQELKEPMRKKLPLATPEVNAVLEFLERADMIKFASAPSDRAEAEKFRGIVAGWLKKLEPRGDEDPFRQATAERVPS